MLVLRLELHSAVTGNVSLLGSMVIANTGDCDMRPDKGNYRAHTVRKGGDPLRLLTRPNRAARLYGYERLRRPVWDLVCAALVHMGFDGGCDGERLK